LFPGYSDLRKEREKSRNRRAVEEGQGRKREQGWLQKLADNVRRETAPKKSPRVRWEHVQSVKTGVGVLETVAGGGKGRRGAEGAGARDKNQFTQQETPDRMSGTTYKTGQRHAKKKNTPKNIKESTSTTIFGGGR